MKKYFLAVLFLLFGSVVYAADPVLFYSDLTAGPVTGWEGSETKGAAVTVWGLNFGASGSVVGTISVCTDSEHGTCETIGDSDATYMVEWADTTYNPKLDASTTIQQITFHLNSSVTVDATSVIYVTVDGADSNDLNFNARAIGSNHIYFIDITNGDDSDDGLKSTDEGGGNGPWQHFYHSDPAENSSVIAGDIMYVKTGTYANEPSEDYGAIDWEGEDSGARNGTATHPISWIGYPGDAYPSFSGGIIGVLSSGYGVGTVQRDYVIVSKMQASGVQRGLLTWWGDYWRVVGLHVNWDEDLEAEFKSATIGPVNTENSKILGMKHVGGGYDHYTHVTYSNCSPFEDNQGDIENLEFAYNEIDDFDGSIAGSNPGGGAFNFRTTDGDYHIQGTSIHHNYMHDSPNAWFFFSGENGNEDDYKIYNNLIAGVASGSIGTHCLMQAGYAASLSGQYYIYNNTIVKSGTADYGTICIVGCDADFFLKNNIINNASGYFFSLTGGTTPTISSDYDLLYGGATDNNAGSATITNDIRSDPQFTDSGVSNFVLQVGSPGVDAGTSDVSGTVTNDLVGVSRPQDSVYDIGAYEGAGAAVGGSTMTGISFPSGGVSCCQ